MMTEKSKKVPVPFGSYVIIRPIDLDEYSKGGILIARSDPNRDRGSVTEGHVVAIGPLAFNDEMNPGGQRWYEVGDKVIYVKYGGKIITYDKEIYIIFRYEDVMCKIDEGVSFSEGEKE